MLCSKEPQKKDDKVYPELLRSGLWFRTSFSAVDDWKTKNSLLIDINYSFKYNFLKMIYTIYIYKEIVSRS